MGVMIGNENTTPIERVLTNAIEKSSLIGDIESNIYPRIELSGFIAKIMSIDQMKRETTWELSQMSSTLGCPKKWIL